MIKKKQIKTNHKNKIYILTHGEGGRDRVSEGVKGARDGGEWGGGRDGKEGGGRSCPRRRGRWKETPIVMEGKKKGGKRKKRGVGSREREVKKNKK